MKDNLYAVISAATGNCIAICVNVEDAWGIEEAYSSRGAELYPKWTYEIKPVTRAEAGELVGKEWVEVEGSTQEMLLTKEW
ncbi:hypothetical protein ACVIRO_002317 [Rhizobium ruizarguesonis]